MGAGRSSTLLIDPDLASLLESSGLDSVEAFLDHEGGEFLRHVPAGDNVRLQLADGRTAFMKRFRYNRRKVALSRLIRPHWQLPSGLKEWHRTHDLAQAGFPVPVPLAAGDASRGAEHRSFYCCLALDGRRPADDALVEAGRPPAAAVRAFGELVGRLHRCGYQHRDLYLCHVFVDESWDTVLIDLQAMLKRRRLSMRRRVKDLAALSYSSLPTPLSRSDRMRFLLSYLGQDRLDPAARLLIAAVERKTALIQKSDARRAARRG